MLAGGTRRRAWAELCLITIASPFVSHRGLSPGSSPVRRAAESPRWIASILRGSIECTAVTHTGSYLAERRAERRDPIADRSTFLFILSYTRYASASNVIWLRYDSAMFATAQRVQLRGENDVECSEGHLTSQHRDLTGCRATFFPSSVRRGLTQRRRARGRIVRSAGGGDATRQ